jgi:hypothetical protein
MLMGTGRNPSLRPVQGRIRNRQALDERGETVFE